MKQKILKKGGLLILLALLVSAPLYVAIASNFDDTTVVALINKDRTELNIEPLGINEKLTQAAKEKAADMILHDYFAHVSPLGVTPWQWIEKSGYDYAVAGENLAINFNNAEKQHETLMNSESHKKNILNEKYKEIGVAVVSGIINGKQTIITVQEFGAQENVALAVKSVAGVAIAKDISSSKDMSLINAGKYNIGITEKILVKVYENIFAMPVAVSLYLLVIVIALFFLVYEKKHGHLKFTFHLSSFFRKPQTIVVEDENDENYFVPVNLKYSVNLGKIYLTHMKMRK